MFSFSSCLVDLFDSKAYSIILRLSLISFRYILLLVLTFQYYVSIRDPDGALDYAKQTISDLLCNKVDISHLVITKVSRKLKLI